MRVALVDYDSGNLHSAEKAFALMGREAGAEVVVTSDPDAVARADRIVLPGDGAFPACRAALDAVPGMVEALREAVLDRAVPFMGICVGMQMLAETGHEYRDTQGLGWIGGEIDAIDAPGLKVPHMGWNDLTVLRPHPLLDGIATGDHAYFVHSWQFRVANPAHLLATVDYGGPVTAVVGRDNIVGTQFHPEKSQAVGLHIIGNFLRWRP
ncbi:imidazole glycerol phosphate synthase subunit HisH [Paracoccus denitrificans]|jgi:glutamine amidotransferase|uniref:Imidazole glycerol phosphate synthase subunit HisH n=1 Tax=Paracoccus denitrificans (strain Pd 1222) TaxID=318586 RepID=A1B385_PARDP|nr:imidazole glycerol phosphate synthase subunit HisH [Paracoccus denitrificans]ABL69979.1 imidazole glycerol phosphate synthase subunit hisH [Paracoccus denitrificans PD1222]MBB4627061.1 glutamine amidotransferase [Paracoccus denitrificans]MCU7428446.1 imidazole glycerol phosphate synthase subunit HisH [Paracoccus denitrificans]QAR25364.1 imidazole glycerol phosphate synthase subunit HisH [Paracoccus denitrificans]UFS65183.1 imidazole glycerol phosphate synthase subunit HisH [Paracoccus denit